MKKWLLLLVMVVGLLFGDTRYQISKGSKDLVVVIHGIADAPYMMWRIEKNLLEEGYSVLNFDYASTKWTMDSTITNLHTATDSIIPLYDNLHFVVHSLGAFVIRGYLSEYSNPKFENLVMIAPPNKGSIIAERFENLKLFEWRFGDAGQKLGKGYDDYWRTYPSPKIPFGIIAGGIGTKHGLNPLIPGDDDGVVGVQETVLEGYTDFIVLPGLHSSLLWQKEVIEQIIYFLSHEKFYKSESMLSTSPPEEE